MAGTEVHYNGVILRDCQTHAFEQTLEYDESGTDSMFFRFRIRVSSTLIGWVSPSETPEHPSTIRVDHDTYTSVANRQVELQAKLSQPREMFHMILRGTRASESATPGTADNYDQLLLVAVGQSPLDDGSVSFTADPEKAYSITDNSLATEDWLDVNNGPKPISVNVTRIFGGRALAVDFEIEVCLQYCPQGWEDKFPLDATGASGDTIQKSTVLLSNRWHLEESKDESWATQRVLQGTARVKNRNIWPHAVRWLCVPTLLNGYQRVRQSFASDATDLVLKYRIEDHQKHAAPPPPAVKWDFEHIESTGTGGTNQAAEIRIRLTGPPGVDKSQLIGAAGHLMMARIFGFKDEEDRDTWGTILRALAIRDIVTEPTIEMTGRFTYTTQDIKWMAMRIRNMTKPLQQTITIDGYRPDVWPVPLPYDSQSPAGIFSCYLQNPCSQWHDMPSGINRGSSDQIEPLREKNKETAEPDHYKTKYPDQLEDSGRTIRSSTDLRKYPYTNTSITSRYVIQNGWYSLPLSDRASASSPSAALLRLHHPVAMREITVVSERVGKHPEVPSFEEELVDQNGIREVLADIDIGQIAPIILPDELARGFRVEAKYRYHLERSPTAQEKLRGAGNPLDLITPDHNALDLAASQDQGQLQWMEGVTVSSAPPA